jgi:hypothetical protein
MTILAYPRSHWFVVERENKSGLVGRFPRAAAAVATISIGSLGIQSRTTIYVCIMSFQFLHYIFPYLNFFKKYRSQEGEVFQILEISVIHEETYANCVGKPNPVTLPTSVCCFDRQKRCFYVLIHGEVYYFTEKCMNKTFIESPLVRKNAWEEG